MKPTQPGRPGARAIDGAINVQRVTITLTEDDRAGLKLLGGSPWVRQQIRLATAAKMIGAPSERSLSNRKKRS